MTNVCPPKPGEMVTAGQQEKSIFVFPGAVEHPFANFHSLTVRFGRLVSPHKHTVQGKDDFVKFSTTLPVETTGDDLLLRMRWKFCSVLIK